MAEQFQPVWIVAIVVPIVGVLLICLICIVWVVVRYQARASRRNMVSTGETEYTSGASCKQLNTMNTTAGTMPANELNDSREKFGYRANGNINHAESFQSTPISDRKRYPYDTPRIFPVPENEVPTPDIHRHVLSGHTKGTDAEGPPMLSSHSRLGALIFSSPKGEGEKPPLSPRSLSKGSKLSSFTSKMDKQYNGHGQKLLTKSTSAYAAMTGSLPSQTRAENSTGAEALGGGNGSNHKRNVNSDSALTSVDSSTRSKVSALLKPILVFGRENPSPPKRLSQTAISSSDSTSIYETPPRISLHINRLSSLIPSDMMYDDDSPSSSRSVPSTSRSGHSKFKRTLAPPSNVQGTSIKSSAANGENVSITKRFSGVSNSRFSVTAGKAPTISSRSSVNSGNSNSHSLHGIGGRIGGMSSYISRNSSSGNLGSVSHTPTSLSFKERGTPGSVAVSEHSKNSSLLGAGPKLESPLFKDGAIRRRGSSLTHRSGRTTSTVSSETPQKTANVLNKPLPEKPGSPASSLEGSRKSPMGIMADLDVPLKPSPPLRVAKENGGTIATRGAISTAALQGKTTQASAFIEDFGSSNSQEHIDLVSQTHTRQSAHFVASSYNSNNSDKNIIHASGSTPAQTDVLPVPATPQGVVTVLEKEYKVLHPYKPDLSDELELRRGDRLMVYQVFDDGWCYAKIIQQFPRTARPMVEGICPAACLAPS